MSRVINKHEIILPEFEGGLFSRLSGLWPVTNSAAKDGLPGDVAVCCRPAMEKKWKTRY